MVINSIVWKTMEQSDVQPSGDPDSLSHEVQI